MSKARQLTEKIRNIEEGNVDEMTGMVIRGNNVQVHMIYEIRKPPGVETVRDLYGWLPNLNLRRLKPTFYEVYSQNGQLLFSEDPSKKVRLSNEPDEHDDWRFKSSPEIEDIL